MRHPIFASPLIFVVSVFVLATSAQAHDTRGDAPNSHYTGIVSETVARQKLQTYGVTGVTDLKRTPSGFVARGKLDNRDIDVEIDGTHGRLKEKNAPSPLAPAQAVAPTIIRDHFMKIERSNMVAPQ